jgi:hypothetical protein
MPLRGIEFRKFRTRTEFGKAMEWSRDKASKLLREKYVPDVNEANRIREVCDMTDAEYKEIFLCR